MKPKIAYLINESHGWGDDPDWKFYPEDDVPHWKIEHAKKDSYKRIVYFEID
jgi:hypothetical protein